MQSTSFEYFSTLPPMSGPLLLEEPITTNSDHDEAIYAVDGGCTNREFLSLLSNKPI